MTQRVEAALGDLHRYLQDEIPPSGAADALARLMAQPPEILMQQVGTWSVEQSRAQSRSVGDLLLHALKKVNAPAEMGLLDREAMANYLDRVSTIAIRVCPVEERNQLRVHISAMRITRDTATSPGIIPVVVPAAAATPALAEDQQSARRFSLIMDRITQEGTQPDAQAVAQLLTLAAARSQTGGQLDAYLEQLRPLTGGKEGNIFVRNLIYLLHRVRRASDDSIARELELLTRASARGQNIHVIKEAVTALGQISLEAAVKLLTLRLAELEAMLLRNDIGDVPTAEAQKLLDRIVGTLARIGSPAALLTIARHGMKANALLGDTRARLAALAQHDLSFDAPTTSVLLKALRDEIPGKLLGRLLSNRQAATIDLIEALSGTHTEETEELFQEIAQRFRDADIGVAAAKVLERWAPQPRRARPDAGATLTGELEFFGLPAVLQSLEQGALVTAPA